MNNFKENLKYNVNQNNVPHLAKKAIIIGGLSMMAAISSVGCSKSDSKKTIDVTEEQAFETDIEKKLSENYTAKLNLFKDIQKLSEALENYPDRELSDSDSLKLENLLLEYVFIETSDNYNGDISYNNIIPERNNSLLTGSFHVDNETKKSIYNYSNLEDKGLFLDSNAVELFNEYYSNTIQRETVDNALYTLYKIETTLTKENEELLNNLSQQELVNLMKSSYVSAYNNMLSANNNYEPVETIDASEIILFVDKANDERYDLTSYIIDDNGNHSFFESTLDPDNIKVIDDYVEAYSEYYEDSSNVDAIISELKNANEENHVSEEEIIEQLTDIALHPEKFDAYLSRTGLQEISNEISDDGR